MLAQLVGGAGGTEVMHQRLTIMFSRRTQMPQSVLPLPFGQLAHPATRSILDPPSAMAPRPGIDQRTGQLQQTQKPVQQHRQQPERGDQPKEYPKARFVAETVVGDQHVTGTLADGPAEKARNGEYQDEDEGQAFHERGASSCVPGTGCAGIAPDGSLLSGVS